MFKHFLLDLIYFGIPTLLLLFCTKIIIPFFHKLYAIPLIYCWFLFSTLLVFLPIFLTALFLRDRSKPLFQTFRIKSLTLKDIKISSLAIIMIVGLTLLIMKVLEKLFTNFSPQPDFMHLDPINGNFLILLAWLPMFFFNIFGEAIYWRGLIFPKQEKVYGKYCWMVHGLLWTLFHLSFGFYLILTLLPILFIIPWVIMKTKNTTNDILIHAFINGSGFLMIAFGLI